MCRAAAVALLVLGLLVVGPGSASATDHYTRFAPSFCQPETGSDATYVQYTPELGWGGNYAKNFYCPIITGANAVGYESNTIDRVYVYVYDGHAAGYMYARLEGTDPYDTESGNWDLCQTASTPYGTFRGAIILGDDGTPSAEQCLSEMMTSATVQVNIPPVNSGRWSYVAQYLVVDNN